MVAGRFLCWCFNISADGNEICCRNDVWMMHEKERMRIVFRKEEIHCKQISE